MIDLLVWIIRAIPVLFALAIVLVIGWGVSLLVQTWRNARAVTRLTREEQDVRQAMAGTEAASVLALLCTLCRDGGHGRCTCPGTCPWPGCVGDHTTVSMLSAADQAYLRGLGISEGEHQ